MLEPPAGESYLFGYNNLLLPLNVLLLFLLLQDLLLMMLLLLFPRCCLCTGHVHAAVVTRHGIVSRLGRHGVCGPRAVWRSGVAVLVLQMKFCVLLLKKK